MDETRVAKPALVDAHEFGLYIDETEMRASEDDYT